MAKNHKSFLLRFDRILAQDLLRQVIILIGVLFVTFLISFFLLTISGSGWMDYCEEHHISKWVFPLYLLIDGNAFNNFYCSEKANGLAVFFACLIYIMGVIIFTGENGNLFLNLLNSGEC